MRMEEAADRIRGADGELDVGQQHGAGDELEDRVNLACGVAGFLIETHTATAELP